MVPRSRVAWTARRSSRAVVSRSRRKSRSRDHSPTYGEGAYWAWSPATCSRAASRGSSERSSRSWRASRARLSSRVESTRPVTAGDLSAAVGVDAQLDGEAEAQHGDGHPQAGAGQPPDQARADAPADLTPRRQGGAGRP